MGAAIIWYVVNFGSALLFTGIGVYAAKTDKPMWFWSGSTIDPATITDVKAYNKANAKMWIGYSLWYWLAGIGWGLYPALGLTLLLLGCTVGIGGLLYAYHRIEKKYRK